MKSERVINVCIFVIVAVIASNMVNAEFEKIDYPIELVLVLDDSGSVNTAEFALLLDATRDFPYYFVMSDQSTRMAVVMFADKAWVEVNLTADPTPIRNVNPTRTRDGRTFTHLGLNDAKDNVFDKARDEALKIVILITDGKSSNMSAAEDAAQKLRDADVSIFVAFVGTLYKEDEDVKNHVDKVADGVANVVAIDGYDKLPEMIRRLLKKITCKWHDGCRFDRDGGCVPDTYRLGLKDECDDESKPTPSPNHRCTPDQCDARCGQWEPIECKPGDSEVQVKRVGDTVGGESTKHMYEHCPKEKTVSCLPATDASGNPIVYSTKRTTNDPDTSSSDGVTDITHGRKEEQSANDSKGELEGWHIGLIVALVLLVLLIVIVAVLTTVRRRKRQATERKRVALLTKKAAKIEATRSIITDRNKSNELQRGRVSVSSTTDGSKSSGLPSGLASSFIHGTGGADTSVGVNLSAIDTTRRSKKPVSEVKTSESTVIACKIKKKSLVKAAVESKSKLVATKAVLGKSKSIGAKS